MDDTVVPFQAKPRPEEKPDDAHVCIVVKDGRPEKWVEFSVEFKDGDKEYSFNFWARDAADAERRLECIKSNATVRGQIFAAAPY